MAKVPTKEQEMAAEEFQYDKIKLILFSQTHFDKVLNEDETRNDPADQP